jgi:hypothetical protein
MTDEGCTGEGRGRGHMYTAAEVKVLTEAALRLGRKEAGDEISEHLLATAANDEDQMGRIALRFAARSAREIGAHALSQPQNATSDATSGVPRHPEVSEAPKAPREPCGRPEGSGALMHTHPTKGDG